MKYFENTRKVLKNDLIADMIMVAIFIMLIFFTLLLTSCANNDVRPEKALLQQPALAKNDKLNDRLLQKRAESTINASSADYSIGPDDLLEISVFEVPELKTTVRVSSGGYIKLPLGDAIRAKGLTVSELESLIAVRLKKYCNEPTVTIFIKEHRSQQISVLGYVKAPGIFYVSGQKSLLDLLSLAGGLTAEGADICIVQRTSAADQDGNRHVENIAVDINELLTNGRAELNIPVISGDIIHVPKSGVFFVDGAVASPGLFPLKGKVSLVQALSMAKGLNYEAARGDIKIYRDNGSQERELIAADYNAILDGKNQDIDLKDKDIIIVEKNGVKSFIKGIATTLNFGMFSVGKGY